MRLLARISACVAAIGLLTAAQSADAPSPPSATQRAGAGSRTLVWAVDGLSFEAFTEARRRGLFRQFQYAGRHVAPYPSMSHPSWTEITGARRLFGARGTMRSIEANWFDLDAMRVQDDPREVFVRQAHPFNYMRAFDWFFDPLVEPLMYFDGGRLVERELAEAERNVLEQFTGTHHVAFLGAADALAHTHLNGLHPYLRRLDAMMTRVLDSLSRRGGPPVESWMLSDHGNAGAFAEGAPERRLTPVSLDAAFRAARLVRKDSGQLTRANEASVVTLALASMINVYFADLERRRAFAVAAAAHGAVDLVTWLEVRGDDRYVVIYSAVKGEATLRWREDGAVAYTAHTGNPLGIAEALWSAPGAAPRWVPDATMRAATMNGAYPDAPFRLMRSAGKEVENAPDLIVNLRDGYCWAGPLGRYVQMVRTHGALGARATLGLVASTHTAVPHSVRSHEVLALTGLTERGLFNRVLSLAPHDARQLAESLSTGLPMLATGRDDDHTDAAFLRRVRPLTLSAAFFDWSALRDLSAAVRGPPSTRAAQQRRVSRSRQALQQARLVDGVTTHLDTLLALADEIPTASTATDTDLSRLAERTTARLRAIPELSPLATLYDLWFGRRTTAATLPGNAVRRAAMAVWTMPHFLDAALYAPETESIPDTRDRVFALHWHRDQRDKVRAGPGMLLNDSTVAPRLFTQILAERELTRRVEGASVPLLYDAPVGDITVVYAPGIFGELFDDEIWQRALRSIRERLGVRVLPAGTDGRCRASDNAGRLLQQLRDDTRRRTGRGYARPRYVIVGYSKGGVDASEALLRDTVLAREQVAALVTIASPHLGTPVAERADIPEAVFRWSVARPRPASCDTTRAVESLWPANRAGFWGAAGRSLGDVVPLYSLSLVSDMADAHPWMKITKRIARFSEENDGVVAQSSSRFPTEIPSVHLGAVRGDHIAARSASAFPQESVLESVLLTLNEVGALEPQAANAWRRAVAARTQVAETSNATTLGPQAQGEGATTLPLTSRSVARQRQTLPGGTGGWTAQRTFRMNGLESLAEGTVTEATPALLPTGIRLYCDQESMSAFREEYAFLYDAGNGGSENNRANGFSIVGADTPSGRACRLRTQRTAMKMTTVAFRFAPADFPEFSLRVRVDSGVAGVAPGKGGRGRNDATIKVWYVLRDERPASKKRRLLFGYTWGARDANGNTPAADSLMEAGASRRRIAFSVLPEAWVINIGGPSAEGRWTEIRRDFAADVRRAFPGVPLDALRVIAITVQSDSDDSRGLTDVLLDALIMQPLSR
ncbi:hypothetical protein [Gemmatimonas phototrophica]|uniref:DUF676 domain-containing protein n=1 Tax=Gemmatimonas phototrophica TaxID=1379270 RepID=A0A143BLR5_9BACT|nr:hypothetical protein [Gemmatimonas phototrophica]AMW05999.1 hypothetical protein GEMMAAP_16800 [Gemmatimonas phototrophica]